VTEKLLSIFSHCQIGMHPADRREIAEQREADRLQREAEQRELAAQREADRQEMAELRTIVTDIAQTVKLFQQEMAAQREADRREMAEQREADRQEMAELRKTTTALVQTVEIYQRNFEQIATYIKGLQVENRRILERVHGPDFDR